MVAAGEALEGLLGEPVRETGAGVGDAEGHRSVGRLGPEADRALAVAQRVVDQVVERLFQAEPVALELDLLAAINPEFAAGVGSAGGEALDSAAQQVAGA